MDLSALMDLEQEFNRMDVNRSTLLDLGIK